MCSFHLTVLPYEARERKEEGLESHISGALQLQGETLALLKKPPAQPFPFFQMASTFRWDLGHEHHFTAISSQHLRCFQYFINNPLLASAHLLDFSEQWYWVATAGHHERDDGLPSSWAPLQLGTFHVSSLALCPSVSHPSSTHDGLAATAAPLPSSPRLSSFLHIHLCPTLP